MATFKYSGGNDPDYSFYIQLLYTIHICIAFQVIISFYNMCSLSFLMIFLFF